jgi:hypothetical protein
MNSGRLHPTCGHCRLELVAEEVVVGGAVDDACVEEVVVGGAVDDACVEEV